MIKSLGIKVAHKPVSAPRTALFNGKDRVDQHDQPGVVYAIPCLGCDKEYIGETGKQLRTRLHEHKLALRRADSHSQIFNHCAETGHEVKIDSARVVARAKKKGERLVLEALHSINSFNRHVEVDKHYVTLAKPMAKNRETDRRATHQKRAEPAVPFTHSFTHV